MDIKINAHKHTEFGNPRLASEQASKWVKK